MKYFATAIQGLGSVLGEELTGTDGVGGIFETEFDGRNDIVAFEARSFDSQQLRTCEDVYVQVSEASSFRDVHFLARELCAHNLLERSLSVYATQAKALKTRMTFRVIARVLSEAKFMRTELRDATAAAIFEARPRWIRADPAELEFWMLETMPGLYRLGLRLTGAEMRHRAGRTVERQGATKPTLAAAMVFLAGRPSGLPLLDATCGAGTILREARASDWSVVGSDIDRLAVDAAASNLRHVRLIVADALQLPFAPHSFGAIACNLPFGKQYQVQGTLEEWLHNIFKEFVRVSRVGASIVLLIPATESFTDALAKQEELQLIRKSNLRLLGETTVLWELRHR